MADVELGPGHTVTSHGAKLACFHLHDWAILLLLGGLEFLFYVWSWDELTGALETSVSLFATIEFLFYELDPFHRFVGRDIMTDLKYPLKRTTIPFWAVPIIAVFVPCLVFLAVYLRRRDVYDLHHAVLGILYSVLVTGMVTDGLKDAVGRPRPDFFWRCFPDGRAVYDDVTARALCHGPKNSVDDGHKSFPSGHASWSFAGLGFFSWYLAGKIRAFDRRGHASKLCLVMLPLSAASVVSITLVDDYMHHWGDVFAGGLLGSAIGSVCYLKRVKTSKALKKGHGRQHKVQRQVAQVTTLGLQ